MLLHNYVVSVWSNAMRSSNKQNGQYGRTERGSLCSHCTVLNVFHNRTEIDRIDASVVCRVNLLQHEALHTLNILFVFICSASLVVRCVRVVVCSVRLRRHIDALQCHRTARRWQTDGEVQSFRTDLVLGLRQQHMARRAHQLQHWYVHAQATRLQRFKSHESANYRIGNWGLVERELLCEINVWLTQ